MKRKKKRNKRVTMALRLLNKAQKHLWDKQLINGCAICGDTTSLVSICTPLRARPTMGVESMLGMEEAASTKNICRPCVAFIHKTAVDLLSQRGVA